MRRLIAWVARFAAALLYRRVEVVGLDRLPRDRPVLLVANHFNGFVDPVLIGSSLGRLPRFIAKATLGDIPVAGFLLRRVGVVFVQRRIDSADGQVENQNAFVECHHALVDRDVVAIFPEGRTHDEPGVGQIKTGAARIALGARAAGATEVTIVPVGLTFPDKVALRSSVLLQFGEPVDLDAECPDATADDHEAVHVLTQTIDRGLREVSPDFPDLETALALQQAAAVSLSTQADPDPPLAARQSLAKRLNRAPAEDQDAVRQVIGRYETMLTGLRLTHDDVIRPTNPARLVRSAFGIAVLVVLLGGLVTATALINLWPALLVALASLTAKAPVMKGTTRAVVGLVTFPTAWIVGGVITADGTLAVTGVVLLCALGALAAVWLIDRAVALTRMLLRWQAQIERAATVSWVEPVRAEVVATVERAAGGRP